VITPSTALKITKKWEAVNKKGISRKILKQTTEFDGHASANKNQYGM